MVSNPIYEGSDGFYEELPDCLPSSEPFSAKASASIPPNIPPMRKMDPQEMKIFLKVREMERKLDRARHLPPLTTIPCRLNMARLRTVTLS